MPHWPTPTNTGAAPDIAPDGSWVNLFGTLQRPAPPWSIA
jgi:hypothetical protein